MRMHADEVLTDVPLVRRLLAEQFPEWAELSLERVPSSGTDNALYRLGGDMVVRLPRIDWAVSGLQRELEWLPRLAPLLPVSVPVPLADGRPSEGYPWRWAVYQWLPGENPLVGGDGNSAALARDLAGLLRALQRIDIAGPSSRRGLPLASQDEWTRAALSELRGAIDTAAATVAWEEALSTPAWSRPPVWLHGDLFPGNLLVESGRLSAVIDFALVGMGDPACDLIAAWTLFPRATRELFRAELTVDDATWARGRGWALSVALVALPYYRDTNPGFAAVARHVLREVLAELES
jgi:aminoglycoside phosphotransferase (APT) family kinase protein